MLDCKCGPHLAFPILDKIATAVYRMAEVTDGSHVHTGTVMSKQSQMLWSEPHC